MDQSILYGQQDFNLPHDVVRLPSKGLYYTSKKESIKVGYLTASDENILMSQNNSKDGIIHTLLKQKIYEPNFNIDQLLDVDVSAILIFLRNTAFGPEYTYTLKDPATGKPFEVTIILDELKYIESPHKPDNEGYFETKLPKSEKITKVKLLNWGELKDIDKMVEKYPKGMVAPVVTKKLEQQIVEIDGNRDKGQIANFIKNMPIMDSKHVRKFIQECEPSIDLKQEVIAPSGERVTFNVDFGVEFFRPFFAI
jgi:hypothetical protein